MPSGKRAGRAPGFTHVRLAPRSMATNALPTLAFPNALPTLAFPSASRISPTAIPARPALGRPLTAAPGGVTRSAVWGPPGRPGSGGSERTGPAASGTNGALLPGSGLPTGCRRL